MNDLNPDYEVKHCEYGVWIMGKYAPPDEISGLIRSLDYRGLKLCSHKVAHKLDALIALTRSQASEWEWLDELNKQGE